MNIPSSIITLIAGVLLTLLSLWYGQNHGLMPVAASDQAGEVDGIFNFMMTIATGLFLLVEGVLIFAIFRFRRKKGDTTDGPAIEGNVPLEIVWTAIPTVIVFVLSIYSFEVYNSMGGLDPMANHDMGTQMSHHPQEQMVAMGDRQVALGLGAAPDADPNTIPLQVDVNGIQYAWIFTYPDTGIVSGDLHVPIDRPVQLNMKAGDVLHAFWLPEFRIKQDVIPGREVQLAFTPKRLGDYPIICAELCGSYHGGMKTRLYVDTPEAYDQWVQERTLALKGDPAIVAANPQTMDEASFLAPYGEELGITPASVAQLSHADHHAMM